MPKLDAAELLAAAAAIAAGTQANEREGRNHDLAVDVVSWS